MHILLWEQLFQQIWVFDHCTYKNAHCHLREDPSRFDPSTSPGSFRITSSAPRHRPVLSSLPLYSPCSFCLDCGFSSLLPFQLSAHSRFPLRTRFSVPSLVKTPLPPLDRLGPLVLRSHGCWKTGTTLLHVHPSRPAQRVQKAFANGWVGWQCSLPFLLSPAKVLVKGKAFYTHRVVYSCRGLWSLNDSTWVFICHRSVDSVPLSARMQDVLHYLLFRRHPLAL